jgi:formylglycine-generating enzyme required for sulfatase activity
MNALPPKAPGPLVNLPALRTLPSGSFLMGGIPEDKFVSQVELPQHRVTIHHLFALGKYPVTRREWFSVMGSLPPGVSGGEFDNRPVVNVTFPEVMAYLRELSIHSGREYRLPTEAEWEYACRAGSTTVFPHGNRLESTDANFLYDEQGSPVGYGGPTTVGLYPANPFGLHDMMGNVCEWTADTWHPTYHHAPDDGSPWIRYEKPARRTIRGGAWDHLPRVLRASWRDWAPEQARWDNLGFRVARTL